MNTLIFLNIKYHNNNIGYNTSYSNNFMDVEINDIHRNKNLSSKDNKHNNKDNLNFHSLNKIKKRKYFDLINENNNNQANTIINLNINNNNYYYINNISYNINSEAKYGLNFSKNKSFKQY